MGAPVVNDMNIVTGASALFSEDRRYRYSLSRVLAHETPQRAVLFVGLNPSTADADVLDPTCRREVAFAQAWGFHTYLKANVYALRSTDPRALYASYDPVGGAFNASHVKGLADIQAELVICAWGSNKLLGEAAELAAWLRAHEKARYLRLNKDGQPAHPLYLPSSLTPRRFV